VDRLHDEVYARAPHGRLVLVGEAGAGKTGAMILLLLAALEHRLSVPEDRRDDVPVPVWLTLGGWDPQTTSLPEWAVRVIERDHAYLRAREFGEAAAAELLRTARVALFLDGLDELAAPARGRALARIDSEGARLRVVLSSRLADYRQAIMEGWLREAAVIELQPVRARAAADYLRRDEPVAHRERWQRVGGYLERHPGSVAARTLNNPLALTLAKDAYHGRDPAPLLDDRRFPTVESLREHLFDRVLINAYPDDRERAHATYWLAWIAHHMGPGRDLAWWHIASWAPRWRLSLMVGLLVALVAVPLVRYQHADFPAPVLQVSVGAGLGAALGLRFRLQGFLRGSVAAGTGLAIGIGLTLGLAFGLGIGPRQRQDRMLLIDYHVRWSWGEPADTHHASSG
jgi:hypothetical protein